MVVRYAVRMRRRPGSAGSAARSRSSSISCWPPSSSPGGAITSTAEVVVVGAGASGLAAAAALKRRGREPLVLDRDETVGGTWERRYDRLHLHTVRRFSGLPYHSLPRSLPRYVSKDDYAGYLAEYAARAPARRRGGPAVERIRRDAGAGSSTPDEADAPRAVVVATGRHNVPTSGLAGRRRLRGRCSTRSTTAPGASSPAARARRRAREQWRRDRCRPRRAGRGTVSVAVRRGRRSRRARSPGFRCRSSGWCCIRSRPPGRPGRRDPAPDRHGDLSSYGLGARSGARSALAGRR